MMGGRSHRERLSPRRSPSHQQRLERADQLREALREILSIARRQMDAIAGLECDRPIAVELQFVFPFRSRRHFGYGETRHRLNEMTDRLFRPTLSTCEPLSTTLHLHFSAFPSHEFPNRLLRLISAGVRPCDSSHCSNSRTRTLCSTPGCLTTTRDRRLT